LTEITEDLEVVVVMAEMGTAMAIVETTSVEGLPIMAETTTTSPPQ